MLVTEVVFSQHTHISLAFNSAAVEVEWTQQQDQGVLSNSNSSFTGVLTSISTRCLPAYVTSGP